MSIETSTVLSAEEVSLVQRSWTQVKSIADTAVDLFYDKLFGLDPGLRALFPDDMGEQKRKLLATLDFAVGALTKPETLLPAVRALGARHASYGVQPTHYALVGAALLATLEAGLGSSFTPETKVAWGKTYSIVSSTMLDGAAQPS